MIKCAWAMWLTFVLWIGLFLFVAFTQTGLFTSIWFQLAYRTTHVVGLTTAIILCNRRAAELRALPPTDAARP
jgi:hypothetical protein